MKLLKRIISLLLILLLIMASIFALGRIWTADTSEAAATELDLGRK